MMIFRNERLESRECSQTRRTLIPEDLKARVVRLSRCLFLSILALQNRGRVFGMWPHFLQPCQKQPSTKTASFSRVKKKSGLPGSSGCKTHPLCPWRISAILKRISVVRLFRDLIFPIVAERTALTFSNPDGSNSLKIRSINERPHISARISCHGN